MALAVRVVVLAAGRLQFGVVNIAQVSALLLGRKRVEELTRIHGLGVEMQPAAVASAETFGQPVHEVQLALEPVFARQRTARRVATGSQRLLALAVEFGLLADQEGVGSGLVAAVAELALQPLRQRQRPAVDGHRLAWLLGQRMRGIGQIVRVQVAPGEGLPIGARAHAGGHGHAGAAAAVAGLHIDHRPQRLDLTVVGEVQVAPRGHLEQTRSGDVEAAVADVAAGLDG
ncbi:hypothetical protein D3C87_1442870 [compost metagenome]